MRFIELTLTGGRGKIFLNVEDISAISSNEKGTEVYLKATDGHYTEVEETVDKIMKMINFNPDNRI